MRLAGQKETADASSIRLGLVGLGPFLRAAVTTAILDFSSDMPESAAELRKSMRLEVLGLGLERYSINQPSSQHCQLLFPQH